MFQGTEREFESNVLSLFTSQGYEYKYGPKIDRSTNDLILREDLEKSLKKINPQSREYVDEAIKEIKDHDSTNPLRENKNQYKNLTEGVSIEPREYEEDMKHFELVDFENPDNNIFRVVNQMEIRIQDETLGMNQPCQPDVLIYLNGLPIGILELKDVSSNSEKMIKSAYNQITDTYRQKAPRLFSYNQLIGVANRDMARVGSFTSPWDWMIPWRYIEEEPENKDEYEYEAQYSSMIKGLFDKERLLDIIKNYTAYTQSGEPQKLTPAYYQYYGVERAIDRTLERLDKSGKKKLDNRQIGIFSHSQGSGKSISILYYVNKLRNLHPDTLFVVLTDTNDLDEQIDEENLEKYGIDTKHADSTKGLRRLLKNHKNKGGVVVSTIQKFRYEQSKGAKRKLNKTKVDYNKTVFRETSISREKVLEYIEVAEDMIEENDYEGCVQYLNEHIPNELGKVTEGKIKHRKLDVNENYLKLRFPTLNERDDIVVISDEAHRTQDKDLGTRVREALPNASQIGFTATPKYELDRNVTAEWFGPVISSYMMDQAVDDGSVVEINYEKRAPELDVDVEELEEAYDELSSESEAFEKVSFKNLIKQEERQRKIARDLVEHHNSREVDGKSMLVAYDKEAAVRYQELIRNAKHEYQEIDEVPETHAIISSPEEYGISKDDDMERRFKNEDDPFEIAIVCKKWTAGVSIKHLHTIYLDKPMRSHNLVQTLGRVNRTYEGKDAGLVVDYVGIEDTVEEAFAKYTSGLDIEINKKVGNLETKFEDSLESITSDIEVPSNVKDIGVEFDNQVQKVVNNTNKSTAEEIVKEYQNLDSLYRRIHPSDTTEEHFDTVRFIAGVSSRLMALYFSTEKPDSDEDVASIDEIIDRSVKAEEAVMVEKIEENEMVEGINNPDVEVQRTKNLLEKQLEDQDTYTLETYKDVKQNIESIVEDYNDGISSEKEAKERFMEEFDKIKEEQEKAEKLGLSTKELSHYNILTDNGVNDDKAKKITEEIDNLISEEYSDDIGWPTRQDRISKAEIDVFTMLSEDWNISDISMAEEIVDKSTNIY